MMANQEKRTGARNDFSQNIVFEFSCMKGGRIQNVQKNGTGVDIGPTGVGLATEQALVKGEVVKVYLPVDAVDATMPVYSEVMWSRQVKGSFRAGLRFLV